MTEVQEATRDVMVALGFAITDDLAEMEVVEEDQEDGK